MSDNDIKIYGGDSDINRICANMASAYEAINFHRSNGNLQKARDLGERLATLSPSDDTDGIHIDLSDDLPAKFRSQDIMYQIKVLLVFAAETLLQTEIETEMLATTAINAMHDKIRRDTPVFFKNISDGAAFTFYYLAIKKGGDITENIGEAFAMLCNVQKNKEGFINAGKTVWKIAAQEITKEITAVNFEK